MRILQSVNGFSYRYDPEQDFLRKGRYSTSYRATGQDGEDYFLKELHGSPAIFELTVPVKHPLLITCIDTIRIASGELILVFPFLPAPSWDEVDRSAYRNPEGLRRFAHAALHALELLHRAGWYHGDLKPSNFLAYAGKSGLDYLAMIDFGKSMPWFTVPDSDFSFSMVYAAPELMLRRYQLAAPPTDLYSLALLMLELIGGVKPFHAGHPEMLMHMMINAHPAWPGKLSSEALAFFKRACAKPHFSRPPYLLDRELVTSDLQSAIARRYQNVDEFRTAFEAVDWSSCFSKRRWFSRWIVR